MEFIKKNRCCSSLYDWQNQGLTNPGCQVTIVPRNSVVVSGMSEINYVCFFSFTNPSSKMTEPQNCSPQAANNLDTKIFV
jgi:hypothetical protein